MLFPSFVVCCLIHGSLLCSPQTVYCPMLLAQGQDGPRALGPRGSLSKLRRIGDLRSHSLFFAFSFIVLFAVTFIVVFAVSFMFFAASLPASSLAYLLLLCCLFHCFLLLSFSIFLSLFTPNSLFPRALGREPRALGPRGALYTLRLH